MHLDQVFARLDHHRVEIALCLAIYASAAVYTGTNAIFVAYGVAMCGIGMLTLTGNTISMDVFGPVADNANGIGEMGYDRNFLIGDQIEAPC